MKRQITLSLLLVLGLALTGCASDKNQGGSPDPSANGATNQSPDGPAGPNADGTTSDSKDYGLEIGPSTKFKTEEIAVAVELVEQQIGEFEGCELIRLWYDEATSDREADLYMAHGKGAQNGVDRVNVIVINSEFVTSKDAGGAFNPDSTYLWTFILIRDSADGSWRIDDWGY